MQSTASTIVVLGTGGTIAGRAAVAGDTLGYRAGAIGVDALLGAVAAPDGFTLQAEQVAQLDSKDMDHATWRVLALRCAAHLARPEVAGLVVTHGTDTLEETAWFLQRVLAPARPVVLAGAMRPATALQADGPQNLADALAVAAMPGAHGVVAVLAGQVLGARDVRKCHPYRLDAFSAGDAGAIGTIEAGVLRQHRSWSAEAALVDAAALPEAAAWPRVEIVASHAGADGGVVRALAACGARGLVVAATGNGSVHRDLEAALLEARASGVAVWRSTRCNDGCVLDADPCPAFASARDLTPAKARVELLLSLLAAEAAGAAQPAASGGVSET